MTYIAPFISYPTAYSVAQWGAVGDGNVDDTAAIQRALDNVPQGCTLVFPRGTYKSSGLFINNRTNITIDGDGASIIWNATGSRIGMLFQNTVDNVTVRCLNFVGNQSLVDAHVGIGIVTGANLSNIKIYDNSATDCTMGFSLAADGAGSLENGWICNNRVNRVWGTASGFGYGIHHANSASTPSNMKIVGNRINAAQRHSIYQAKGDCVDIIDNQITNHRQTVGDTSLFPAIVLARTANVVCADNTISTFWGGGIMLGGQGTGAFAKYYNVTNNTIELPQEAQPCIFIGQQDPTTETFPDGFIVSGNILSSDIAGSLIQCLSGKRGNIYGNHLVCNAASGVKNGVRIQGTGDTTGNLYTDDLTFDNNYMYFAAGGTNFAYNIAGLELKTIKVRMERTRVAGPGTTTFFGTSVGVTNPNLRTVQDGAGSPEGVVIGNVGSQWIRNDGGAATTLYIKETGTDKTGWVGK